ncbi:oligosaccharide flippase family protein [Pseudoalteromonas sp. G4]|uniref:oligosaccharide flippase family protein n=1 Tax=Pseudoalteromonas sp. G4 TaxID=2992761 RepID=UPI00237DDA2D|nr:oligosaccharide flippase family protein [Pseudoalteromonas sp. G4]MDE3270647.1 oligosaccharide flippase family protein [Pseudoalteromonas sp. G4]
MYKKLALYLSANLIAQIITLLSYPLITRVYSSSEIGLSSPILMGLAMFMSFSTLNLPYLAMTLNSKFERDSAFSASLQVSCFLTPLILVFSACYFRWVEEYSTDMLILVLLVAATFLGSSLILILERFLQYYEKFNVVSFSLILASIVGALCKLIFAFLGYGYWGLILAFVVGLVVQLLVCLKACMSMGEFKNTLRIQSMERLIGFVSNTQFTFFRTSQAFIWFITTVSISTIVLTLYGTESAGIFSLAWLMASAVGNILGKALFDIFYSTTTKLDADNYILKSQQYWSVLAKLVPALFLFSVIAYFFAGPIFKVLFGAEWAVSGYLCVLLFCSFTFGSILAPIFISYIRWNKQHIQLFFSVLTLFIPIISMYIVHSFGGSLIVSVAVYSAVNIIILAFSAFYCTKLIALKNIKKGCQIAN